MLSSRSLTAPRRIAAAPVRRAAPASRAAVRVNAAADLVETAKAAGTFKARLVDTLKKGTFTVFAPTDAAFAKLPAGTVEGLLKDKTRLTEILLFHVAKGKTASKWIINGSGQMPTMCELPDPKIGTWKVVLCVDDKENGKNGAPLVVGQKCATVQGLAYEVRGGKVVQADIECSNGIIHVLDTVMIPDVKFCGV